MKKTEKKQLGIPPFYATMAGDLLIVQTNNRDLPIYGSITAKLPSEIRLHTCKKDDSGCCATMTLENGIGYLRSYKFALRLQLELSIYPLPYSKKKRYYLSNI